MSEDVQMEEQVLQNIPGDKVEGTNPAVAALEEKRKAGERFVIFYVPLAMEGIPFYCLDLWVNFCEHSFDDRVNAVFVGEGPLEEAVKMVVACAPPVCGDGFLFSDEDLEGVVEIGDMVCLSEGSLDFNERLKRVHRLDAELAKKLPQQPTQPLLSLNIMQVNAVGRSSFPRHAVGS